VTLPPTSFPKSEIKVLLLENIHASADEVFATEGYQVERVAGSLSEEELCQRVRDVHLVGIRSKTRITARVLDAGRRLLSVGAFCIGTNQIDVAHAGRRGVPVFNAPFANTRSVAELVLAEVIILSRHLFDRSTEVHAGLWHKMSSGSHEIRGKTLGIVGYGHIGRQVGVLAETAGMQVLFYDIAARLPMGNNRATGSLTELLGSCDFVTLHVPETPQTRGMIGAAELAAMRPGACLLNLSRGTVVDLDALAAALREGRVGGAAIDVYPEEPRANRDRFESVLCGLPNVILTPHIGGSTEEAQESIGREVAGALVKFVNSGATTGAVGFPEVDLPATAGSHRILNVHANVPGVIRDISQIISDRGGNIRAQSLATDPSVGYLVIDLDQDVSHEVKDAIAALSTSVKTRILY